MNIIPAQRGGRRCNEKIILMLKRRRGWE